MVRRDQQSILRVVWLILSFKERRKLIWVFVLIVFGTLLETFSLGLVVPTIGLLTSKDYLASHPRLNELLNYPSQNKFVVGAMMLLVAAYLIKSLFLITSMWIQFSYSSSVTKRIG